MNQKIAIIVIIFISLLNMESCSKKTHSANESPKVSQSKSGPPVIIYKTTKDFSQYIPVILSEDKKTITSFPDVKDVFYKGVLAYPSPLKQGYWLDNRGIGPQVAFLDYTYKIYANFKTTPPVEELQKHILDKAPLTEMYHCGVRGDFSDLIQELNKVIDAGTLYKFQKLY
ncbi:MAG: hypothetical protein WCO63_13720 [Bacteroidota bacterium]